MTQSQHADLVVEEDTTFVPICPHCDSQLTAIRARQLAARGEAPFGFGKRYAYACPHCNKLLAISHRKGFWMG